MATAPKPRRKTGRPSKFTPQLAATICEHIEQGGSLRAFCDQTGAPGLKTVMRWLDADAAFRQQYAWAKERGIDGIAEIAIAEAIKPRKGEDVPAARLAFDARRWYVGKLAPKRWGDKVINEHRGPDGGPIQAQPIQPPMVPREIAADIRALIAKSGAAMGLPAGNGSDAERLKALVRSDQPLPPDLYEALYAGEGK